MAPDDMLNEIKEAFGPALEIFPLTQQLELADLRLLESSSTVKLEAQIKNVSDISQSINVSFNKLNGPNCIAFNYFFSIIGKSDCQEEVIRISARYGEIYRVNTEETIKDEDLGKYGHLVGLMTIWPYWREFVQSITMRMGLPPLTLPIIRSGDIKFTEDKQKKCGKPSKHTKVTKATKETKGTKRRKKKT